MKKVLIIANQFPPMGGSGVQRTSKFVKNLPSFGYEPYVLTRDDKNLEVTDLSLLKDIGKHVSVTRTKSYDFTALSGILKILGKIIARKVLIPDGEVLWQYKSRKTALAIIKREKIDLIYTTSYPYSDHLLGLYLKRLPDLKHIKWIADFRDEWINNPYTVDNPHNFIRTSIEKRMEKQVLESADVLITNTPVMRCNFIKNNPGIKNIEQKFHFIPNGYDIEDFATCDSDEQKNEKCIITYTGGLYGRRKPDSFFAAIQDLHNKKLIDSSKLEIRFIGNYYIEKMNEHIVSYGIREYISVFPYMPHNECIKYMNKSDILLLIEGEGVGADAFYTGKVFEYMIANKPVLAVLPNGCARDLVIETNIGLVSHVSDVAQISECVLKYYNDWLTHDLKSEPSEEIIKRYERKELTRQLAELFDRA